MTKPSPMTHNNLSAQEILDALHSHVAVLDRHGNITHVNEAWVRFSEERGAPPSSTGVGVNYFAVCRARGATPEVEEILAGIRAVIDEAVPQFRAEYTCSTPKETYWFELMTKPLPKPHRGAVVYHTDITELKKARDEYAVILNGARGILWRAKLPGFQTIFTSKHVESILGYPAQAWTTQPDLWVHRIHPEDRDWVLAFTARATEEARNHDFEYRMISAHGQTVWLRNIVNVIVENGRPTEVVGISIDISERKRAEEALRGSEARLRLAIEVGKMYAYEWDVATDTILRSPEYVHILGFGDSAEQLTRQQILDRVHPDDQALVMDSANQPTPENPTTKIRYRMLRPDGSVIWLESNGRAFFDAQGRLVRMIGMVADITERKRAEEALASASRKLIEAQEQERARIARELHDDINQRLAMLAVELGELQENPTEVLTRVQELQKEITGLSNDVQALSHELHSSKLEYLGVVAGIKSWCKEFAGRHNLEIEFTSGVSSTLPSYIGLCLFRVLQEAAHNAVKYSGVKRIEVQLQEESGQIHLNVSDSGAGFDVEAALQGKGLGLTSMRERVRLLNGTISIASKPMSGTTIHVRVPLESKRVANPAAV